MSELIDTHVHFDDFERDGRTEEVLANADESNVVKIVAIGGSRDANKRALELAKQHGRKILCACGYDRDMIDKEIDTDTWQGMLREDAVVAVGECGLDYHYSPDTAQKQKKLMELNLQMAAEFDLPVVVHSRDADEDTVGLLRDFVHSRGNCEGHPGVLHCFTRTKAMARDLLDLGFHLSFSGIVTFKNAAALREVAAYVPDDRILIETDSPYLAPEPLRGQINEPAFVRHVAEMLATVRKTTVEEIAEATTRNAQELFGV